MATEGTVEIKVILDEKTYTVKGSADEFVLDLLLEEGIDAPYSCQGGVCSSCIAKISSGTATMLQNNILTESEIEEGLVLTCQAVPQSPSITIDFDDV